MKCQRNAEGEKQSLLLMENGHQDLWCSVWVMMRPRRIGRRLFCYKNGCDRDSPGEELKQASSARSARLIIGWVTLLALLTLTSSASAARPDPVSFGLAVERGDLAKVEQWLEEGLDPDFVADRIGSGLMIAAWEGNIAMLELFHTHGARIDLINRYDEQALQLAAWKGHLAAVKWLLAHGASVNRRGRGWGALHYAAFADRDEVLRLLIENGGDINARSPNGSTALMMTAREGHEPIARLLLDAGADATLTNDSGESALTWAMRHEHFKIAQQVSSPPVLSQVTKAPPESFGAPVRSQPAPPEIEEILGQIRLAEATGRPVDELRKKLFDAVARFKKGSQVVVIDRKPSGKSIKRGKPQALVITAHRGKTNGHERVELVYAPKEVPSGDAPKEVLLRDAAPTAASAPAPASSSRRGQAAATGQAAGALSKGGAAVSPDPSVPEILESISRARAAGKPVDDLRKALFEAIARFRREPEPAGK